MYDKIKLYLKFEDNNSFQNLISKMGNIDNKSLIQKEDGEDTMKGYLKNLNISINRFGMSIVGSLAKYYFDSNVLTLDRHGTKEAIEKLSDDLCLSLEKAKVLSMEFGTNFPMKKNVSEYLSMLKNIPRMERIVMPNGLYFQNKGKRKSKILAFYDKKTEAKTKDLVCPFNEDCNLLRYEIRYKERLSEQLKMNIVTASDLFDKAFYTSMIKRYQDYYFSIEKTKQININNMEEIKTVSGAKDLIFARLLNQADPETIERYIQELKEENVFQDRKYYSRVRNELKRISSMVEITSDNELIKELNDDIKNCSF